METIKNHLTELMSFYEVATAGGFSRAAENLQLSKGQLSKHVARLETLLSAQLFHRTTRKVALTEEGKQLLYHAEKILRLSREAAESMGEFTQRDSGVIRLTAPSSLGDWLAPRLMERMQREMPRVKIELDLSNVKRDLEQDGYDFAFRAMDETNPRLIARYVGHLKDVIVAAPEYVKKNKLRGVDPLELKDHAVILSSLKESWNTWKMKKGNRDVVVEVQGNFATTNYQTNRVLALQGLGIARIPYYLVTQDLKSKALVQLYQDYAITTHPLYLVYPAQTYQSKRQKLAKELLWNWLKSEKNIFE